MYELRNEINKEQQGTLVPDQLHSFRIMPVGIRHSLHSREKGSHLLQKKPSL